MKTTKSTTTTKTSGKNNPRYVYEEFGINLGQIIREQIALAGLKQTVLAKTLGISTIGMQYKLNNPTFGTIYDIIKTCKFLNVDLFNIMKMQLIKRGFAVFHGIEEQVKADNIEAAEQLIVLKKENELLKDLVKLRDKLKK